MSEHKEGYYWVKDDVEGWYPALWIGRWCSPYVIDPGGIKDSDYLEIGPRILTPDECCQKTSTDGWIDASLDKPKEAQEVLFVRNGRTVHGAWIGGIFWHNNEKCAALWWQPMPQPRLSAAPKPEDV